MSIEIQLKQLALQIATDITMNAKALRRDLEDINRRKLELEKKIEAAALSIKRADEYQPKMGIDYTCPQCRVRHDRSAALRPIPSTTRQDIFRCGSCGVELTLDP